MLIKVTPFNENKDDKIMYNAFFYIMECVLFLLVDRLFGHPVVHDEHCSKLINHNNALFHF